LVAGVDCSTQATKVAVVDAATGALVTATSSSHQVVADGASETDPRVWEEALAGALAATGLAPRLRAISVAAQQHGLVCLDASGHALGPAVLWDDTRSGRHLADLVAALGGASWWAAEVGSVPSTSFTAAHWLRLVREEPDLAAATAKIRLPHDYLTERLCGAGVTDRGDASGTGWWSPLRGGYVQEVLDWLGLPTGSLPRVLDPDEPAGTVGSWARDRFGLPEGCLVGPGTGDNMAAALGLAVPDGAAVVSLGTSGTVFTPSRSLHPDTSGRVAGFADATGGYLPLVCTLNCTLAVDQVAVWLGLERDQVETGGSVVVLPFFKGERTPRLPLARGLIDGLTHATTRGQVLLAAYEGAAFPLVDALEALRSRTTPSAGAGGGADSWYAAPLRLVGGGAAGAVWQQVVGGLAGRPLLVPEPRAAALATARGAAAQAAAVLSGRGPAEVVASWEPLHWAEITVPAYSGEVVERLRRRREALLGATR
jgi:xylulokinase